VGSSATVVVVVPLDDEELSVAALAVEFAVEFEFEFDDAANLALSDTQIRSRLAWGCPIRRRRAPRRVRVRRRGASSSARKSEAVFAMMPRWTSLEPP